MQQAVNLSSLCKWKRQKMVVFVVKRCAVGEAIKAVRSTQGQNRAVRSTQGGGGVTLPHTSTVLQVCAANLISILGD